mmetsp:Transcript_47214/g.107107  ORF Transcript_47214/g.107107 Transcript_47214/m.107107 type:complete len:97 (-) Transcript_47214:198-488(-)
MKQTLEVKEDGNSSPPGLRSAKSTHSIISGKTDRERVDTYGNLIQKGSKHHRCSFRDEQDASQAVHDVKEVTAYKTPYFGADYREDDKQGCACTLM